MPALRPSGPAGPPASPRGVGDALRVGQRAVEVGVEQHDGELLAAGPRDGVAAAALVEQHAGDGLEHLVADGWPKRSLTCLN